MGLFTKKHKPDIVDFTVLEKRGILQKTMPERNPQIFDRGSAIFGQKQNENISEEVDFLSSLAGAGASSGSGNSGSVVDSLREARRKNSFQSEISDLKVKLDNQDFKIDNLHDKLKEIERKLREKGI